MNGNACRDFDSCWTETSAAGSLMDYIGRDVNGLRGNVAEQIGGVEVAVDTKGFSNDLITLRGRDEILTLALCLLAGNLPVLAEAVMAAPDAVVAELSEFTLDEERPQHQRPDRRHDN